MSLDSVGAGIGLGFVQGLTVGIIIAVIVFARHAWRDRKNPRHPNVDELSKEVNELRQIVVGLQATEAKKQGGNRWTLPLEREEMRLPRAFAE
jgi:hypothetical protein